MDKESRNRYSQWIYDYFPEPKYNTSEVRDYIDKTNPNLPQKYKDDLVRDWENVILTVVEEGLEGIREGIGDKTPSFWKRIKGFLGRLFGR